jgi:phage shock protein PspC (stress-responsive transcriptional regulator)
MKDDTARIEPPAGDDETAPPRRLRRSSTDRVLAGVAGGLGRHLGVDPIIFRIGFVLSLFFGGLGALAYLLLALFVPTDGEPDRVQRLGRRLQRSGAWRAIGIALIALVAVAALFTLAAGGAFAVALGWGVPVAIGVIAIGAVLALTAFRGGARWLIPPVMALVIGAGVASAADLDFRGGIGEREYHPVSAGSIPAGGYKLGVGRLAVDLRDLDWHRDSVVHLDVRLGTGQADLFVPENVCITGPTHVGAGESEVAGEQNDGFDVDYTTGAGSHAVPRVELDAKVDIGQLRVINSDTANVNDTGYRGPFDDATAPQRAAEQRACARA